MQMFQGNTTHQQKMQKMIRMIKTAMIRSRCSFPCESCGRSAPLRAKPMSMMAPSIPPSKSPVRNLSLALLRTYCWRCLLSTCGTTARYICNALYPNMLVADQKLPQLQCRQPKFCQEGTVCLEGMSRGSSSSSKGRQTHHQSSARKQIPSASHVPDGCLLKGRTPTRCCSLRHQPPRTYARIWQRTRFALPQSCRSAGTCLLQVPQPPTFMSKVTSMDCTRECDATDKSSPAKTR